MTPLRSIAMVTSIECVVRKRVRKFHRALSGCYVKVITIRGVTAKESALRRWCAIAARRSLQMTPAISDFALRVRRI